MGKSSLARSRVILTAVNAGGKKTGSQLPDEGLDGRGGGTEEAGINFDCRPSCDFVDFP